MKYFLIAFLLFSTIFFGQNNFKIWDQVIELENEDKIKSASELVEKIYKKASRKNNEAEIIKCFFYKSKYLQRVDENAQTKIIDDLNYLIKKTSAPSKAILQLVYAKCLQDYANRYSYDLQKRTKIEDQKSKNFLNWTYADFYNEIENAYKNSLKEESKLKNSSLSKYESIFDFLTQEKLKNTTVLDYVLEQNINRYRNNGFSTMSGYIDDYYKKDLLGNTTEFLNLKIDTLSSESAKEIITLFKKLEENPSFEKQFYRVKFMNESFIRNNENYQNALNRIQKYVIDDFLKQKIWYEKANYFHNLASKGNPINYNLKTIEVIDSILKIKNSSNAYKLAQSLKNNIKLKTLAIQLEKYIYPNQNTRAHISYKNVDSLKISFYKIDLKTSRNIRAYYYEFDKDSIYDVILKKQLPDKVAEYILPNKNDFFEYTTEVLVPKLDIGNYLVCFESNDFLATQKIKEFETITVSNISILASENDDITTYQVIDRKTGKPIQNVTAKNDYFEVKTNQNGIAFIDDNELKPINSRSDYYEDILFYKDNDSIMLNYGNGNDVETYSKEKIDKNQQSKIELYLDRAIYRPGQTVYYKGIVFQKSGTKTKVVSNLLLNIIINDVNYDELKDFEVTTNEFGSFSGEFVIPKNGLTGNYSIEIEKPEDNKKENIQNKTEANILFWNSYTNYRYQNQKLNFRVEEYKRPKFEITFDKIKHDILLNQKVKVKGLAKAFSGSVLTNAKVNYVIERNYYSSYYDNYDNGDELYEGELVTDENGNFEIEFVTQIDEDEDFDNNKLPIFNYIISVEVTDINGETRSAKTAVKAGFHTLELETYINSSINPQEENQITFNSTNLNDEFVATNGELKLYFKKEFQTKFKRRVFYKPEIEGFTDEEFERLFPYEFNEKNTNEESLGELVYTQKVNTETQKQIELDFIKNYKSGYYTLVFSATDKNNYLIESKRDFEIVDTSKPISKKLFTVEKLNHFPKKDGFISLKIHSSLSELYVYSTAIYKNLVYDNQNIDLKNGVAFLKIPMKKEFESSIKINFECFFENQLFTESLDVNFTNEIEKIEIETETFRNKIEPGSNEFWSFKLKQKNNQLESEVLASMYDSSLDQFTKQDWNTLYFYNNDGNYARFRNNFCQENTFTRFKNLNYFGQRIKTINEENKLIWFGFDFTNNYNYFKSEEYKRLLNKKIKKPSNSNWIYGYVNDNYGPIPGVNVIIRGTKRGVQTDFDGYYEIEAAPNEVLIFSFIGMEDRRIIVGDETQYDITLIENNSNLQEVVVTGMGIQKEKKSLGYAVSNIKGEDLAKNLNNPSVLNTLSGKVAGVQVQENDSTGSKIVIRGANSLSGANEVLYVVDGVIMTSNEVQNLNPDDIISVNILKDAAATSLYGTQGGNGVMIITTKKGVKELTQVKARKNLAETAFFFPHLKTDKSGKLSFNFTSPEALTEWKLRLLAHNKNAISGYLEKSIVTQKDIMITPNFPRFLREKDSISITAKVSNCTGLPKSGIAVLQFMDATTLENIDSQMLNINNIKNFTIPAFGNTVVSWKIYIPENLQGVHYKILAKSGNFSDGEENILPVLTNNMLVTESMPLWVRENSKKEYTFENLKNNNSTTLRNHQFVLEYTSNPTWIAIKSLPYLMTYEHGCAEQLFSRYYSNALASEIIDSNPKIATVFKTWRDTNKSGSKLEENEELKSIILAETPWINEVKSEDEKKKKIALLFDLEKMKNSQEAIFNNLKKLQKSSGGFAWFNSKYENEYITRHVLAGFGHLKKLISKPDLKVKIAEISKNGIPFLDQKFLENNNLISTYFKNQRLVQWDNYYSDYHYLYTRSFYLDDFPLSDTLKKVINKQLEISKDNWLKMSLYQKAQLALTLNRFGDSKTAKLILEGLKETASNNEDWGMYWIENKQGWYWYQAPIETQALLIEAFSEITNDTKSVDAMKVWLLKNKQNNQWSTTKATTEAVYALLLKGNDWLSIKDNTVFKIGDEKIMTKKLSENQKEAETGYVKLTWKTNEVKKEMATIKIENKSKVPGFGGVYWQYFEDLDKIKNDNSGNMTVEKELYIKRKKSTGEVLEKITTQNQLKIGDLITVKLTITSKENMEFVHLKDMRASCFEPINVLSENIYQNKLYYYMSTKDAATHFFFDQLNKGTYSIEYDVRVNNSGNFSNGITTIQSMYAPEFSSHTKGIRVDVKE